MDAPSNLGLRPPTIGSVPGCAKAPGALRDARIVERLRAYDAGCVTPPRYDPGTWRPGDGVSQAETIAVYSRLLAARVSGLLDEGYFPVLLGGDCSITLGVVLALRHRASIGRYGLVYLDGHADFRHEGNAPFVGAAAGENLALVTGRGHKVLTDIDGLRPYVSDADAVVIGIRQHDEQRFDLQAAGIEYRTVPEMRTEGATRTAAWAREVLADCAGYWVHVDVDILDPSVMPAVDAPGAGGVSYGELEVLLAGLTEVSECLGVHVTVFDPDYDSYGAYAEEIVRLLANGLR